MFLPPSTWDAIARMATVLGCFATYTPLLYHLGRRGYRRWLDWRARRRQDPKARQR